MSDQRKMRKELKQGLHQYLMQMYMSYLENMSQEEAKGIVADVIAEQYQYFRTEELQSKSAKEALAGKIDELTAKIEAANDYDTKMYLAEKVDHLQHALAVLDLQVNE